MQWASHSLAAALRHRHRREGDNGRENGGEHGENHRTRSHTDADDWEFTRGPPAKIEVSFQLTPSSGTSLDIDGVIKAMSMKRTKKLSEAMYIPLMQHLLAKSTATDTIKVYFGPVKLRTSWGSADAANTLKSQSKWNPTRYITPPGVYHLHYDPTYFSVHRCWR